MNWSDLLAITSAVSYTVGSIYLANAVEFHADKLILGEGETDNAIRKMGSPGRIDHVKLKRGKILTGCGLALFVLSFVFR